MPLWSVFLLQMALPPNPPAITAPPPCPTPPQYTYSDWEQTREERQFQGEWVVQYLHYSRTKSDECRETSVTQRKVEGPYRLWPAVPANRVADVNRPEGATDSLSGSPLRSSSLPEYGVPGSVGPNSDLSVSKQPTVPANKQPAPDPFYPGFVLFAGVLVASLIFRRRTSKQDLVPSHVEEPAQGPPVPQLEARTLDSMKKGDEWVPEPAEVAWLQAFFGLVEPNYGPLTKAAVAEFQRKHGIPPDPKVMVGPNTYRALWKEHINLVHEQWQGIVEGRSPLVLERVFDSPMPPDLREEMSKLNDAYAAYWTAVEGRYQAILRRDVDRVAEYDRDIQALQAGGIKVEDIPVLKAKYQPLIDGLYNQAEKVKKDANDGEYAKLLAMLAAADQGKWDEILTAKATAGGRWDALWSRDKSETAFAQRAIALLEKYTTLRVGQDHHAALGAVTTESGAFTVQPTLGKSGEEGATAADSGLSGGWSWPKEPFKLGGTSVEDVWLTQQIESLNSVLIPKAARFVVRNQQIVELKKAGTPPTAEVALPSKTDPEVQSVIRQLTWDQSKIDKVWAQANEAGVDPRIMLAVVLHEGTGSFNTNADVPVQWWDAKKGRYVAGGSGAQPNFEKDLENALDAHILAKMSAYSHYGEQFKAAVESAGLGDGNVFQYANYNVPWFKNGTWTVSPGCYATDTQWWTGIQFIFNKLAGDGADRAYSDYLRTHPLPVISKPPAVRFIPTNGGTGSTEEIQNQPWIEARP